jgi:tspB protein (fragment)
MNRNIVDISKKLDKQDSGNGKGGNAVGDGKNDDGSGSDGGSGSKEQDWQSLSRKNNFTFEKDGRFSESGLCPQPVTFNLTVLRRSQTFAFSYEHVCDLAVRMRPILIACAYFAAGLICLAALER